MRGWRSVQIGRLPLSDLTMYYAAQPCEVQIPALLIRINRLYRHGMSALELYEATRGTWKLSARRNDARYAFAVFEALVREVYEIEAWHRAASTPYATRDATKLKVDRWEFTGRPALVPSVRFASVSFAFAPASAWKPIRNRTSGSGAFSSIRRCSSTKTSGYESPTTSRDRSFKGRRTTYHAAKESASGSNALLAPLVARIGPAYPAGSDRSSPTHRSAEVMVFRH